MLKPIEARTLKQMCSLKEDNIATHDWWILLNEGSITICNQASGESAKDSISIPRHIFDKFARWYVTGSKKK